MSRKARKELNHEVEAILDEKIVNKETLYLIHWKRSSKTEDTWEAEKNLNGAEVILKKWKAEQTKKCNLKEKPTATIPKRSLRSNTTIPNLIEETKPTKPKTERQKLNQPEKSNNSTTNKINTGTRRDSLKRHHPTENDDKLDVKKTKLNPTSSMTNAPKTRNLRSKMQEKDAPQAEQIPMIEIILTPPSKKGPKKKDNQR
jgi:hypothetical protein